MHYCVPLRTLLFTNTVFSVIMPLFRYLIAGFLLMSAGCKQYSDDYKTKANRPEYLHGGMRRLTDIIRHDFFPPPVSSRIYAYSAIAAYEALIPGFPDHKSLAGQLNDLQPGPQPEAGKDYCFPLASATALLTVGKQLIFSEKEIQDLKETYFKEFEALNMPPDVYKRSTSYGEAVAKHIIAWSKTDNYLQTRSMPKFTIDTDVPGRWQPTPPAYADALEPHWSKIRPWVMDSAAQFSTEPPLPFSTDKKSAFYKQALEVYEIGKRHDSTEVATAWYWDDNPFAMQVVGHLSFARKKISPGGHWVNITAHACRKANADMMRSAEAYVKTACALADGFIACWTAKYVYNLIRPESYINQHIDPDWMPLIQTPPFPEHASGHSTISAAAATVLTDIFGDNFTFTDSTEVEFDIPARTYSSFHQASDEVGMSRLYGGIHYRRGNEAGIKCGRMLGAYVARKIVCK